MAAGVILTGGLVGGVLLTPGTAFADTTTTTVGTTTAIINTAQTSTPSGTTLTVTVAVRADSGTTAPTGSVTVTAGSGTCQITLAEKDSKPVGVGSCPISGLAAGNYTVTATYDGAPTFTGSATSEMVQIGKPSQAPMFVVANPPLTATAGQGLRVHLPRHGLPRTELRPRPGFPGLAAHQSRRRTCGELSHGGSIRSLTR